jgi:hypothetical protein
MDFKVEALIEANDDYGIKTLRIHQAKNGVYGEPRVINYDTVTRNPRLSEGHRVAVADSATVDVAPAGGLRQEEAMWARFAGLARGGGAAAEGAGFWAAVALQTQAVLDACMESGLKAGGLPVPVKPL